jgi:hypothetical protein
VQVFPPAGTTRRHVGAIDVDGELTAAIELRSLSPHVVADAVLASDFPSSLGNDPQQLGMPYALVVLDAPS